MQANTELTRFIESMIRQATNQQYSSIPEMEECQKSIYSTKMVILMTTAALLLASIIVSHPFLIIFNIVSASANGYIIALLLEVNTIICGTALLAYIIRSKYKSKVMQYRLDILNHEFELDNSTIYLFDTYLPNINIENKETCTVRSLLRYINSNH